jgi:hypothetical protein
MRLHISVQEAAALKGVSRGGLWLAIKRGEIDADKVGRAFVVKVNKKFEEWERHREKQRAGKIRQGVEV